MGGDKRDESQCSGLSGWCILREQSIIFPNNLKNVPCNFC